jgi:hypothetical protein
MDGCYQKNAFQRAYKEDRITNHMIQIAENIQTIHNSLALDIPQNTLSAKTSQMEAGDFKNTNKDDGEENYDGLLSSIGELFATLINDDGLTEDTKTLDVQFTNKEI